MATSCVTRNRAFTLVEVLVGIAVVSALASVGYVTVGNVREGARENKLQADVISINAAVQAYLGNGGTIPDDATAETVIAKLKTRANDATGAQMMGVKGSFLDARVQPELQSGDEEGGEQLRAVWNAAQKRFVLTREGSGGIKSFNLDGDASAEPAQEARTVNLAASDVTSGQPVWVWDHADNVAAATDPGAPPQGGETATTGPVAAGSPTPLDPPLFGIPDGDFDVVALYQYSQEDFVRSDLPVGTKRITGLTSAGAYNVSISNPNPQNVSYLDPGNSAGTASGTVTARAVSTDPDVWSDSEVAGTFGLAAFPLEVSLTAPTSLTPFELGVPSADGGATITQATVAASITNWAEIPALFRVNSNFQLVMAVGGQNPATLSGSAQQQIGPVTLTTSSGWNFDNGNPTLTVGALAKAVNTTLFTSSAVQSTTITVTRPELGVSFTPASGPLNASQSISIGAVGNYPAGAVIRYTTDGSTPSASTGTLYTAAIIPPASGVLELKAIAVPPAEYANWFTTTVAATSYTIEPQQGSGSLAGVMVSKVDKLNGEVNGSIQLLTQINFNWNGSTDINGDLYLIGTPVFRGNLIRNNPGYFTERIRAGITAEDPLYVLSPNYFGSNNPAFVSPAGVPTPNPNYTFTIDAGEITGTIYTRASPSEDGLSPKDAAYLNAIVNQNSTSLLASYPIPTSNVAPRINGSDNVTLAGGNYGSITVSGTLNLGSPGTTTSYNFNSLTVNGNGKIVLNGPVIISLKNGGSLNNILGTTTNPDWLSIYNQGNLTINGGGGIFAKKIVTNKSIEINGLITLGEGVIADSVGLNGGAVLTVGTFNES